MPELIEKVEDVVTTSGYVSALLIESSQLVPPRGRALNIITREKGGESIDRIIYGSPDGVWYETIDEDTVAGSASDVQTIDPNVWLFIDVQVKDTVAETHGLVDVFVTGE